MRYAQIISTGSYVPKRVVTNAQLEQTLGESLSEWLTANVGIRERHYMADAEVTSGLAPTPSARRCREPGCDRTSWT